MKLCLQSRQRLLLCDTLKIVEKVPGLIDFKRYHRPTELMWDFWQSPSGVIKHPINNWCKSDFADSLQIAIFDFYNWSLTENEGGPIILSLNDMSLELGGRYDIDTLWENVPPGYKPQKRHYYHRNGISVDINRRNGLANDDQIDILTTYMKLHGMVRNDERPEIHYGFNERY